jgi:hypothetical protein
MEVIFWVVITVATYAWVFFKIKQHDKHNSYVEWIAEGD